MPVLVTGVGYIGSRLVQQLLEAGEEVVGVDNFFSTAPWALRRLRREPRLRFLRGDVANPKVLALAFAEPIHTVFSLAAQASAHPQAAPPGYTERTNLLAPRLLLDAMLAHDVRRVVFGSSLRVYGAELPPEVQEDTPYGSFRDLSHLSKVYNEKLIEMYAVTQGLACVTVRLGVTYGVSPAMKDDYRFMTVLNKYCLQAVRGEPLRVYADGDMPVGFIHVDDAAAAMRAGAAAARPGQYVALNAATEVCSVRRLATMVAAAAQRRGRGVVVEDESTGLGRTARVISSLTEYGFRPKRSLASGIEEVLDYWETKCES